MLSIRLVEVDQRKRAKKATKTRCQPKIEMLHFPQSRNVTFCGEEQIVGGGDKNATTDTLVACFLGWDELPAVCCLATGILLLSVRVISPRMIGGWDR